MSGGPYLNNAGAFLVQTLFGFYILTVMLRFLLQTVRADFYNPLVQFLVKLTDPPLVPLRRIIPGFQGMDLAAIVLMMVLKSIELVLLFTFSGYALNVVTILLLAIAELLGLLINILFWGVIIQAVLSWINPNPNHPAVLLLRQITEPVLSPARRILPPISGIDLSPILVLVALQLINMLLVAPLRDMAFGTLAG
jgi:YggT family protein